ncbi:MAG: hypothetical protein CVV06_12430 [Gammaproteobacteria bacterium HGW-Gammaproteobacteria-10]|nr:MAG: hypothetical protein CVV06_12430 [Gammaproteobacteria bacterium HGW-Gammaproteobacteria-10]
MSNFFYDGIEMVLPSVAKAYPQTWAEDFLTKGIIYFTNAEIFRRDEHPERGDLLECANYVNPIFLWCTTMESQCSRILETWNDRDSVVYVRNSLRLAERIRDAAAKQQNAVINFQVGPVVYERDLNQKREYFWGKEIFQKDYSLSSQKEFRFALVGNFHSKTQNHIVLQLGDCSDIAEKKI